MQASTIGTNSVLLAGEYDAGSQFFAPAACGHTIFTCPSPGTSSGLVVLAPVFGSIDVTRL